jgi:mannose/cellobiose epimerase-like protein (N-acyl-D-glucosamine 2-epimerase family)
MPKTNAMQRHSDDASIAAPANLRARAAELKRWLLEDALPLWWERGADRSEGGYVDRLDLAGRPVLGPRRVRVQARQTHVYALAPALGWQGPAEAASGHGLQWLRQRRGDDGLYRASAATTASSLDGMGLLYDQAFVLLALASHRGQFGEHGQEAEAAALADRLADFADPAGGFRESADLAEPLFANPNMHLFESFQAWSRPSEHPRWRELARLEARLALERLIDPQTGALGERFAAGWRKPASPSERFVWPGHLYEWAFLLMDWADRDPAALAAAVRLIEAAERAGVDHRRGVVIFALGEGLAPSDDGARLWSQTERIRACARGAALTGEASLWEAAAEACTALEAFLDVPTPGLWRDWMAPDGSFRDEPAPASSLYHIVGAVAELVLQTSSDP